MILIDDRHAHSGGEDRFERFAPEVGPGDAGILFVQMKAAIAERWFAEAGRNLDEIQAGIDQDLQPAFLRFARDPGVHLSHVDIRARPSRPSIT